jgi:cytidine deaminase
MRKDLTNIFKLLKENQKNSCSTFSKFRVSALIEDSDGELFQGVNVESSSYGLTICAEQSALVNGLSYGKRDFVAIYILGDSDEYIRPCGACRQLLYDYGRSLKVYMFNSRGDYEEKQIEELLPFGFSL